MPAAAGARYESKAPQNAVLTKRKALYTGNREKGSPAAVLRSAAALTLCGKGGEMTKEEYLEFCGNLGGAVLDSPFSDDFESVVARHSAGRKWFALVMKLGEKWVVNLKCNPLEADFLRKIYEGVIPAYHMNKTHWNTVFLDSDVPRAEIERMTLSSFELTEKKSRARKKREISPK